MRWNFEVGSGSQRGKLDAYIVSGDLPLLFVLLALANLQPVVQPTLVDSRLFFAINYTRHINGLSNDAEHFSHIATETGYFPEIADVAVNGTDCELKLTLIY